MRAVHQMGVTRQQISETSRGRAKTCALCGEAGHNKRTCPQNSAAQVGSLLFMLLFCLSSLLFLFMYIRVKG